MQLPSKYLFILINYACEECFEIIRIWSASLLSTWQLRCILLAHYLIALHSLCIHVPYMHIVSSVSSIFCCINHNRVICRNGSILKLWMIFRRNTISSVNLDDLCFKRQFSHCVILLCLPYFRLYRKTLYQIICVDSITIHWMLQYSLMHSAGINVLICVSCHTAGGKINTQFLSCVSA